MRFKESKLWPFRRHRSGPQSCRSPESSIVSKFPTEIWDLVASNLPLSSAAALKAAGSFLYAVIHEKFWLQLNQQEHREAKLELLQHLDRLFPDHVLCSSCTVFHPKGRLIRNRASNRVGPTYRPFRSRLQCEEETRSTQMIDSTISIPWRFVQLVKRAHRLGPDYGFPVESFNHLATRKTSTIRVTARIVDDRLLIRTESFMPIEISARSTSLTALKHFVKLPRCKHRDCADSAYAQCHAAVRALPMKSAAKGSYACQGALHRCLRCPSEHMITLRPYSDNEHKAISRKFEWEGNGRYILKSTQWIDLGDCKALGDIQHRAISSDGPLASQDRLILELDSLECIFGSFEGLKVGDKPAEEKETVLV